MKGVPNFKISNLMAVKIKIAMLALTYNLAWQKTMPLQFKE